MVHPLDNLIRNFSPDGGEAIGQRLIVMAGCLIKYWPVPGTLVEFWQANAAGRYRTSAKATSRHLTNFSSCGRAITDENGYYHFRTQGQALSWPNGG